MGTTPGDDGLSFPTRSRTGWSLKNWMKTELEGDSQGSEEQLLHLHKTWRIEEVQAVISRKHDEGKVIWSEQESIQKQGI